MCASKRFIAIVLTGCPRNLLAVARNNAHARFIQCACYFSYRSPKRIVSESDTAGPHASTYGQAEADIRPLAPDFERQQNPSPKTLPLQAWRFAGRKICSTKTVLNSNLLKRVCIQEVNSSAHALTLRQLGIRFADFVLPKAASANRVATRPPSSSSACNAGDLHFNRGPCPGTFLFYLAGPRSIPSAARDRCSFDELAAERYALAFEQGETSLRFNSPDPPTRITTRARQLSIDV